MRKTLTTEEFIKRAKLIYGNKYDYSKVVYKGIYEKVIIICPIHGEFETTPNNFLNGKKGCNKCGHIQKWDKRGRMTTEEFIEKAKKVHGEEYDYSKVEYKGTHTKVCIICPIHGEFWQQPANHLSGNKCPRCSKEVCDTESFIKKSNLVHNNLYDYSKSKFVTSQTKTIVICKKHGDFVVTPNNHLKGEGCPICKNSSLEEKTRQCLKNKNISFEQEKEFEWLKFKNPMRIDFYLPKYDIAIECQGEQHFKPINYFNGQKGYKLTIERDKKKKQLCEEHDIKLYYINYDEEVETKLNEILAEKCQNI